MGDGKNAGARQRCGSDAHKNPYVERVRWNSPRLAVPMMRAAFVQKRSVLNIVIDKEIIVTNACYIRLGSIVLLPTHMTADH